jgi:hypothetical protein
MAEVWLWLSGEVAIDWDKIIPPLLVDGKPVATVTELERLMADRLVLAGHDRRRAG